MKRTWPVVALAAALLAPVAQAQTRWSFSYTGFEQEGVFDPGMRVTGSFLGSDADGDGVIAQSEVVDFIWNGFRYEPLADYCYGGFQCELSGFRYSLDGRLDFRFHWLYRDEMSISSGTTLAGQYIDLAGSVGGGGALGDRWLWTDQTRFAINPPPVPEPGRLEMAASGLLVLAAWAAARRRR